MNLGDVCLSHAEKVIAIGLAVREDFEDVHDGVCRPCEEDAAWDAIPVDQRIKQVDDGDGTMIVGDPRNPHFPVLRIEYPLPGRSGGLQELSERGKRMREMVLAFERAYPTADERKASIQPDASTDVNIIRDLKPRRLQK